MIIAISGTPGTGKHTLADRLSRKIKYEVLDLNPFLTKGKKEEEVTLKKLNRVFQRHKKDNLLVVSHLAHFIESKQINLLIVLRTEPMVLAKRLRGRRYSKEKIRDNVIFEAMNGTYEEALKMKRNVFQIDNTQNIDRAVKKARLIINGKGRGDNVDFSGKIIKMEKMLK
jgi:adenylate kinase